jgi:segregation and condensation protein B
VSDLPLEQARAIVESILLTAAEPVTIARLGELLDGFKGKEIRAAVVALNELYAEHGHGFNIVEVAGGFQLATRSDMATWVRRFHQDHTQMRLSQAALEALAIVAFKQPITRVEVDSIRGVNSAGVLQTLMELDMARIVGRSDGVGRPMLFGTTKEFLIHFGLKSLAELPKPKELEELLAEGERKAQSRNQLALDLNASDAAGGISAEDADPASDDPAEAAEEPADTEAIESEFAPDTVVPAEQEPLPEARVPAPPEAGDDGHA